METNESQRQKLERLEFLAACKACKVIFCSTPSLKEKSFDSSEFSAQGTLISASAVPQCGFQWKGYNKKKLKSYGVALAAIKHSSPEGTNWLWNWDSCPSKSCGITEKCRQTALFYSDIQPENR